MQHRLTSVGALAILIALALPAHAAGLKFTAEIPKAPAELPLLGSTAQPPPIDLVNGLLAKSRAPAKLGAMSDAPFFKQNKMKAPADVIGAFEDDHIRAWVNRKTGDVSIYPSLGKLEPLAPTDAEAHAAQAREIFGTTAFIAKDDTRFVIDKPNTLNGQTLTRDASGAVRVEKPKAGYLNYFQARRFVGDLPVYGPGSRALLEIGRGGSVEGMVRVWKSAKTIRMVKPSLNADQLRAAIAKQLAYASKTADVTVDKIELAYYDSNNRYIFPVIRFTAQIHRAATAPNVPPSSDDHVVGYIPYAQAFDPLPVLGQVSGPSPRTASKTVKQPAGEAPKPNDPLVGRYVDRNDDAGWVNDANAFWNSLSSSITKNLFTNSQYYWAEPRLFTNQKNSFVNSVNIGLNEVHGNWWIFWTYQNNADTVNINGDIPNPGYGPSANGVLATWILHSCEVVPAPDDTANWPDPWWTVFGGVRNVVGYRTIMYINDGAGGPYGTSLGNIAPVVSSWLSDVSSLNDYSGHPTAAAHGGIVRPMGRASTISACGHDSDNAFAVGTLGRASCLTVWWFPD